MLTIETASNGWIVRNKWRDEDESEEQYVCVIPQTDDDITGKINLLNEIADTLNMLGSRYDKWRVHITKKHGDKWEKGDSCEQNQQS